jgi:hypothetical protein
VLLKVKAQIFHSDYTCEIVTADLKNEEIIIGPYRFSARKVRPFIIHKFRMFSQPLYIFKSTTMVPLAFEAKEENVGSYKITYIEPIQDLKFYEKDLRFNPELAKGLADLSFLKEMLKYAGVKMEGEGFDWRKLFLIIGGILLIAGVAIIIMNPSILKSLAKALNIHI